MAQTNQLNELPYERFDTYRSEEGGSHLQMTAELSDLNIRAGQEFLQQIYPDACDVGIAIRGKRETVIFHLTEPDMSGDEIAGWNFEPISECVRKNPRLKEVRVLLIND